MVAAVAAGPVAGQEPPEPSRQEEYRFESTTRQTAAANYLLYLPESYDREERLWPLLVHLHGGGGSGDDVARLRVYPLVRRLEEERDFPFVVVSPQCPLGEVGGHGPMGDTWSSEHAEMVDALLERLLASHRMDPDRIAVIGHSMGGYGAYYLAHRYPRRFAAVVPIAAPGVTWWTYRPRDVPYWVFHGERDEVVPIAEAEKMVAALREIGAEARFTRYPEGGHVLREPFRDEELFAWLLAQRREPRSEAAGASLSQSQTSDDL
jgi:predicted peptidase